MIKKTCAIRAGMAARVGVRYIYFFFYKAKCYGCVLGNLYTKSFTPVPIAAAHAQGNKKKATAPDAGGKMPPRDY